METGDSLRRYSGLVHYEPESPQQVGVTLADEHLRREVKVHSAIELTEQLVNLTPRRVVSRKLPVTCSMSGNKAECRLEVRWLLNRTRIEFPPLIFWIQRTAKSPNGNPGKLIHPLVAPGDSL